jgi:hypothetical protein
MTRRKSQPRPVPAEVMAMAKASGIMDDGPLYKKGNGEYVWPSEEAAEELARQLLAIGVISEPRGRVVGMCCSYNPYKTRDIRAPKEDEIFDFYDGFLGDVKDCYVFESSLGQGMGLSFDAVINVRDKVGYGIREMWSAFGAGGYSMGNSDPVRLSLKKWAGPDHSWHMREIYDVCYAARRVREREEERELFGD